MNLRTLLALTVVLTAGAAFAQVGGGIGSSAGVFSVPGGISGIKGAPYSADVIEETTRVLADGNRIHQETHGKQCRDSEGRTRSEMEFPAMIPDVPRFQHIAIMDSVQQLYITLDPRTKTAFIHHMGHTNADDQSVKAERQRVVVPPPNAKVLRDPATMPAQNREQLRSEDLGAMEVEGFTIKGTRITHTIPAGEIGNEQPITSVFESWISPILKIPLLAKNDDPQSGQHTTKLVNIQTTEPDPSLFQVPPDYTIKDDAAPK
jgi:hypothetical protein